MNIRWTIHVLALFGIISSVIYQVKMNLHVSDATFDGVTFFKSVWILITFFESVWILIPYIVLVRLNESKKNMYKHPRMFVLLVIMILSLGIYMMLDIVVFTPDPLGGVAMLFWVPLQTLCILAAWGACK